jgi:putative ABC transport system permease protein
VVSLFGALLGVLVGVAFGWMIVIAIPIIDELSIPITTLLLYVVIATVAGLVAASFPARRAARLNVLEAIGQE